MKIEKINFIQRRICDGESPCVCIPNFQCPYLDKKGNCILYYNANEEEIMEKCDKAFVEWLEK